VHALIRTARLLAGLTVTFAFFACSTRPGGADARQMLTRSVDELCRHTGMTRVGPIGNIERLQPGSTGYVISVHLNADGTTRPYRIPYRSENHPVAFRPDEFYLSEAGKGLGFDTVKDTEVRSRCIAAVSRLNQHLQWTWYGPAAIQPLGENYIVTYETVSPAEQKKDLYLDPYVTFVVTPKGTVFAVFFGG
jgi:hypothetical protein